MSPTFRQAVRDEVESWSEEGLLGDEKFRQFKNALPESRLVAWEEVYRWMTRIATKYGLTRKEFDEYCTMPSTSANGTRIFYPFHILSRPQAKGIWQWHTLYAMARAMLSRMRTRCNKYAEAAGLGERQMDPARVIYWWAHHLCQKIQGRPEMLSGRHALALF
ncbi:hypothetical protein NEMBOFW57_007690 [Staphylotrichum longicolle]|uniref:Uncharacterized protein n=1 Tax=Staphylotrichum longicolle TaxID=669026 RepID=A0AAD4HZB6_9PEZI|nr:hypothetical protein NEMBOFW57_007690 [Staphylotrichum longicolle]